MSKERRRAERLDANLFAELETVDGRSLGRAVVTDVSLTGLAIETEADVQPSDVVVCHVEIPLNLLATVVRSQNATAAVRRFGVRFKGLSLIEKFLIRRLLKGSRKTRKVAL